jgi:hypothetical protein
MTFGRHTHESTRVRRTRFKLAQSICHRADNNCGAAHWYHAGATKRRRAIFMQMSCSLSGDLLRPEHRLALKAVVNRCAKAREGLSETDDGRFNRVPVP